MSLPFRSDSFIGFAIRQSISRSNINWQEKDATNPLTLKILGIVSVFFLFVIILGVFYVIKSTGNKSKS